MSERRKNRVAIVNDDEGGWYVRRIRVTEHDLDKDEKVYRCDLPIGQRFSSVEDAAKSAKEFLGVP